KNEYQDWSDKFDDRIKACDDAIAADPEAAVYGCQNIKDELAMAKLALTICTFFCPEPQQDPPAIPKKPQPGKPERKKDDRKQKKKNDTGLRKRPPCAKPKLPKWSNLIERDI